MRRSMPAASLWAWSPRAPGASPSAKSVALAYLRADLAAAGPQGRGGDLGRPRPGNGRTEPLYDPGERATAGLIGASMPAAPIAAAPATDLLYARSAALVVLAGVLWSMGGFLVKLVETRGLGPDRPLSLLVRRSPVAAGFIPFRGTDLIHSTWALGWNGLFGCGVPCRRLRELRHRADADYGSNAAFVLATTPFTAALLGGLVLGEPVRS